MKLSKNKRQDCAAIKYAARNSLVLLALINPLLVQGQPTNNASLNTEPDAGFSTVEGAPTQTNFTSASRASMQRLYHDKIGMFVHWGPYAVLGGVYNGQRSAGEWIMNRSAIPVKTYEQVAAKKINLAAFDANEWAQLAKDAGMGFVVVTAKHHDGFAMFDSKVSDYDITDFAATGRDPMKELADAVRSQDIRMGFYYSQTQDWHETGGIGNSWDFKKPSKQQFSDYLNTKAIAQVEELVSNYGELGMMWFDTPGPINTIDAGKLIATVNKHQPQVLMNSRIGGGHGHFESAKDHGFPPGVYRDPKNATESIKIPWQTHTSVVNPWGYTSWASIKPAAEFIGNLAEIVSKGGVLLLNVAPDGSGKIPEAQANVLRQVGNWLQTNGEAIYDADPSPFDHPKQPITAKAGRLYIHLNNSGAGDNSFELDGLLSRVTKAYILSDNKRTPLIIDQQGRQLRINLPPVMKNEPLHVLALELADAQPRISDQTIQASNDPASNDLAFELPVSMSYINTLRFGYDHKNDSTFHWSHNGQSMYWNINVAQPGRYQVISTQAVDDTRAGMAYSVSNGLDTLIAHSVATGSRQSFTEVELGILNFDQPGHYQLTTEMTKALPFSQTRQSRHDKFNLRSLKLVLLTAQTNQL